MLRQLTGRTVRIRARPHCRVSPAILPLHPSILQRRIPVYGKVAAGIPIEAITDIDDYEEIDEAMAASGEYFALRIRGDSMEPRMRNGDTVIVRRQDDCDSGDVAIVMIGGEDATCKRIRKLDGGIMLIPDNQKYDPMIYTRAEAQQIGISILGKVVELRARY